MKKIYCIKSTEEYIRKELNMSVRGELHDGYLDNAFKKMLENAKERAKLSGKRTILKEHL